LENLDWFLFLGLTFGVHSYYTDLTTEDARLRQQSYIVYAVGKNSYSTSTG